MSAPLHLLERRFLRKKYCVFLLNLVLCTHKLMK